MIQQHGMFNGNFRIQVKVITIVFHTTLQPPGEGAVPLTLRALIYNFVEFRSGLGQKYFQQ